MATTVVFKSFIEQGNQYDDAEAIEVEFNKEDLANPAKVYIRQFEEGKQHEIFIGDREAVELLMMHLQFLLQQKWGV